jgi:L-alanine-DL-glutamate epimerase-like enolase superfamily enzyme
VTLRQLIPQKVALHLSSLHELVVGLRHDAADFYNLLGPLHDFVQWARIAQNEGCPTWRGTGIDLGIRDVSSIHAAAAAGCSLPSDIIGHLLREDDLIVEAPHFNDGYLMVPEKNGLGIELDRDALEFYSVKS